MYLRRGFSEVLSGEGTRPTSNGITRTSPATRPTSAMRYFVVSFAGHVSTPTAAAVMEDIRRGVGRGHEVGLLKDVLRRFGKVQGSRGELVYEYDALRVRRFVWKVVRGIYYLHVGRVLPEDRPFSVDLLSPADMERAVRDFDWFHHVRDTEPMARYLRRAFLDKPQACFLRRRGACRAAAWPWRSSPAARAGRRSG
jgi:hypothetical protein